MSFPQWGQMISISEPLSALQSLRPHTGQDTYSFIFASKCFPKILDAERSMQIFLFLNSRFQLLK